MVMARELARKEGLLVGISSGGAVHVSNMKSMDSLFYIVASVFFSAYHVGSSNHCRRSRCCGYTTFPGNPVTLFFVSGRITAEGVCEGRNDAINESLGGAKCTCVLGISLLSHVGEFFAQPSAMCVFSMFWVSCVSSTIEP